MDVWEVLRKGLVQRRAEIEQKALAARLRAHAYRVVCLGKPEAFRRHDLHNPYFLANAGRLLRAASVLGPHEKGWFEDQAKAADGYRSIASQKRDAASCRIWVALKQMSLALGQSL